MSWPLETVLWWTLGYTCLSDLVSLLCVSSSGISGSFGSSISSFLRNLHTALHSDCTSLHSHKQRKSVPFSLHPLQNLLFVDFLTAAILTSWLFDTSHYWRVMVPRWDFDLHFSDNEWCWASCQVFFSHLYVSLEKCLLSSLAHFLFVLFIFLV